MARWTTRPWPQRKPRRKTSLRNCAPAPTLPKWRRKSRKIRAAQSRAALEKAAADKHLQVVTTDWFRRTDSLPGVGPAPELANVAFSAKPNNPPESAKLPQGYAILQVLEVKPASTPSFDEIRAKVET